MTDALSLGIQAAPPHHGDDPTTDDGNAPSVALNNALPLVGGERPGLLLPPPLRATTALLAQQILTAPAEVHDVVLPEAAASPSSLASAERPEQQAAPGPPTALCASTPAISLMTDAGSKRRRRAAAAQVYTPSLEICLALREEQQLAVDRCRSGVKPSAWVPLFLGRVAERVQTLDSHAAAAKKALLRTRDERREAIGGSGNLLGESMQSQHSNLSGPSYPLAADDPSPPPRPHPIRVAAALYALRLVLRPSCHLDDKALLQDIEAAVYTGGHGRGGSPDGTVGPSEGHHPPQHQHQHQKTHPTTMATVALLGSRRQKGTAEPHSPTAAPWLPSETDQAEGVRQTPPLLHAMLRRSGGRGQTQCIPASLALPVPDIVGRPLFATAAREAQALAAIADRAAAVSAAAVRRLTADHSELNAKWQGAVKRQHFAAWRNVALREKSWRRVCRSHLDARVTTLIKAKAFFAWKSFSALFLSGQTLATVKQRFTHANGGSAASPQGGMTKDVLRSVTAMLQHTTSKAGASNAALLRRVNSGGSNASLNNSKTPTTPKRGVSFRKGNPAALPSLLDEDENGGSSSDDESTESLRHRVATLRERLKTAVEERALALLDAEGTLDALSRGMEVLTKNRTSTFAMKASDLLMNARRIAIGDASDFLRSSFTGVDNVALPVVGCRGHHVLLSWANAIVQQASGSPPKILSLKAHLNDCRHYNDIVRAVMPQSDLGDRLAAIEALPEKFALLVSEVSKLAVDSVMRSQMTFSRALSSRWRGSQRSMQPNGTTTTPHRQLSSSSRLLNMSGSMRQHVGGGADSSWLDVPVVPESDFSGLDANADGLSPAQIMAANEFALQGPLIAAGIRAADLLSGHEESHLFLLYCLFRIYEDSTIIDVSPTAISDAAAATGTDEDRISASIARSKKKAPSCIGTGYGSPAPMSLVNSRAMTADRADTATLSFRLAFQTRQAWKTVVAFVEESLMVTLHRLARGHRAATVFQDTKEASALRRFLLPIASSKDDGGHDDGGGLERFAGGARSGAAVTEAEGSLEALSAIVVNPAARNELIEATHVHGSTLQALFGQFAPAAPVITPPQFETLLGECRLFDKGLLPRGTGISTAKRFARHNVRGALTPLEFVVALVHVSEVAFPLVSHTIPEANLQYSNAALRFGYFLTHIVMSRVKLVMMDAVKAIMQEGPVASAVSGYSRVLRVLFGSAASMGKGASEASRNLREAAARKRDGGESDDDDGNPSSGAERGSDLSLTSGEFLKLMRDLDFVDAHMLPPKLAHLIFQSAQDCFDESGDADMSYGEFEEAMIAVALTRTTNPFLTPAVKIHSFFSEKLIPQVRKKFPAVFLKLGGFTA